MADSPLQKYPRGLLESLDLKTLGHTPNTFGETVVPVVDAFDNYLVDRIFTSQLTPVIGAIGQTLFTTLSVGPARIQSLGALVIVGAAAGTWVRITLGFRLPSTSNALSTVHQESFVVPILGAGRTLRTGVVLNQTFIIPSGGQTWVQTSGDAAGVDHSVSLDSVFQAMS